MLILTKIAFFLGLLCCQCLEELNVAYNNIALIAEVKKLASLTNLSNLSVEGELKQKLVVVCCSPGFWKQKFMKVCLFVYLLFFISFYSNVFYLQCYHYFKILVHLTFSTLNNVSIIAINAAVTEGV